VRFSLKCSLAFFGLAALNLRVDSCMFEMRFLMLAEGSALGISLLFFLESLCELRRLLFGRAAFLRFRKTWGST
jgi:hypothetical protein